MKDQTYLFYDIETTGLNKCFDQVIEFAAIRTDAQLNELEQYEIKIKLNPDVIPSPKALITNRISIKEMLNGLPEVAGIAQIHKLLNAPGTISLGYNTLKFDDEFLRFSFFRNLLTPYTHQYAARCSRMDLYPICIMYYLYRNDILNWPEIDGKISLKLEHLNEFNHMHVGTAHRAIEDVKVTLALARVFFRDQTMWEYVSKYFQKENDLQRIRQLSANLSDHFNYPQAILVDGKFGKEAMFQSPVLGLGTHKHYSNRTIWLRLDKAELRETTEENLKNSLVFNKKFAENGLLLPIKDRYLSKIPQHTLEQMNLNLNWLTDRPLLLSKIADYHQNFKYEKVPNLDTYAVLYESGFPTSDEIRLFDLFHNSPPDKKINLYSQFSNATHRELALRILGKHFTDYLPSVLHNEYQDYIQYAHGQKRIDYKGNHALNKNDALEEIAQLRSDPTIDNEQVNLLNELEGYLNV